MVIENLDDHIVLKMAAELLRMFAEEVSYMSCDDIGPENFENWTAEEKQAFMRLSLKEEGCSDIDIAERDNPDEMYASMGSASHLIRSMLLKILKPE